MDTKEWLARVKQIDILDKEGDQLQEYSDTIMPEGGEEFLGQHAGILSDMHHEKLTDPRFVDATEELFGQVDSLERDLAVCVRSMHWQVMRAVSKPADIVRALSEAVQRSRLAWKKAKEADGGKGDFRVFAPKLKELFELSRDLGAHVSTTGNPYDAFLDGRERGLTQKRALELCEDYLVLFRPLLQQVMHTVRPNTSILDLAYPRDQVLEFCRGVGYRMGVDKKRTMHGFVPHPYTIEINPCDVHSHTWQEYKGFKEELTTNLHEDGHALHHLGFRKEWAFTPMARCSPTGISESQSMIWERMIGASSSFWEFYFKFLKERLPALLEGRTWQEMYRAFNVVTPGPIRVEADTLTYIPHLLVRTRIEGDVFNGILDVNDIPDAWEEHYWNILGVLVPTHNRGCLQDGHWSWGDFGYFPCYGNGLMSAAQIAQHLEKKIGLWELVRTGEFALITESLRNSVHRKGDAYTTEELVQEITGSPLSAQPLIDIMTRRLSDVYGFSPVHA